MSHNVENSNLAGWLATPQGRYVLDWELEQIENAIEDVFGYRAAQLGLPGIDCLRGNRIPFRFTAALEPGGALTADALQLPLASHSLDLLVLPHVLEFSPDPHQVLREAGRVLMPDGQIVIAGFNPLSLWGLRQSMPWRARRRPGCPWDGNFIGLLRIKDWLQLLGFELNGGKFGCYAPPFASEKWLQRLAFMERAGARWWPIAGGVYVVRAIKRTLGMRLVAPAWRIERARRRGLAPVANAKGGMAQCNCPVRQSHPEEHV